MTPRRRSSKESEEILLYAPRSLKAPVGWRLSGLKYSALSLLRMGDVHRVVPFKNLLAGCLRGVAVVVLVFYGEIHWGYGVPMAVGGLVGGLPRRCAHGQGKPHRAAFGGHDYWARLVGILLLDPLRPVGTIHHRRVNPTGFREAPRCGSVAVREVGAKGLFAVALTLVTFREVESQPAVWPDREEHRPCSRLSELRLDEALGRRWDPTADPSTVTYLYGNSSRCTVRLSTPALSMYRALRGLAGPCVSVKNVMLPPGT